MALGNPTTKVEVDARVGQLSVGLRETFRSIQLMQAWLATQTDPQLTTLGYSAGEVATLKSAFTDLDQLRQVYEGTATRTPAYDYRTFSKLLAGVY